MTLLEKITRELPGSRVEPAELNGRPAWRITLAGADLTDGGTFEAFVYQEAARVQIRHLDAYHEAKHAVKALSDRTRGDRALVKRLWKAIDHFRGLSGFTLAVPAVAPEVPSMATTCSICPRGAGKCARHGKPRMAP